MNLGTMNFIATSNQQNDVKRNLRSRVRTLALGSVLLVALTGCNAAGLGAQGLGPAGLLETGSSSAVEAVTGISVDYTNQYDKPATVTIYDEAFNQLDAVEIEVGDTARFEDLEPGTYLVTVYETSGIIDVTPDVSISGANITKSDPVVVVAGQMTTVTCSTQGTCG